MEIVMREDADSGITIVDVSGELELFNHHGFQSKVLELLTLEKKKVVVNLDKLRYIDSSGIGSFVACFYEFKKADGMIKFSNAHDSVKEVIGFTNLDKFFDMHDTEQDAINSFS